MIQRKEFIDRLAVRGYTKHDAGVIVDDFLAVLEEALVNKEDVMFRGFGTFEVRERKPRESVAVNGGERITIPGYFSPHFTAGKLLKREIKEGQIIR